MSRSASAFNRIYGSEARAEWIKTLPCFAIELAGLGYDVGPCSGEVVNMHTATGGMSYKAGAETIAPSCDGHHKRFGNYDPPFDQPAVRELVKAVAARTDETWKARPVTRTSLPTSF